MVHLNNQKTKADLVIAFVVVGQNHLIGVKDLFEAADLYLADEKVQFIVLDNSGSDQIYPELKTLISGYKTKGTVLKNETMLGIYGGLYYSISKCMNYAVNHYDFDAFLKIDPDTLITGFGLMTDIKRFLNQHPQAGIMGSYKYTCAKTPRVFSNWEETMAKEKKIWSKFLEYLEDTDYIYGEHVQGGGELFSSACVKTFAQEGLLERKDFGQSNLCEEVIFAMLARSLGFKIYSFVDDHLPFAISWQGLPMSVREIRKKNKKVIHSIKFGFTDRLKRWRFKYYRKQDKDQLSHV